MAVVIIATLFAVTAGKGTWWLDQGRLRCGTQGRGRLATVLAMAGTWVLSAAYSTELLGVSGLGLATPGILATLLILMSIPAAAVTIIATVVSLFAHSDGNRWYRTITPTLALALLAPAVYQADASNLIFKA